MYQYVTGAAEPGTLLCTQRMQLAWPFSLSFFCVDCAVEDSHSQLIAVFVLALTIRGSYKEAAETIVQTSCLSLPHNAVTVSSIGWAWHFFVPVNVLFTRARNGTCTA